ncbi:uncharacterized protein LOC112171195 [Rosa chinensis]|uniref:uncharacterized protein LOC112171195 n=1 Tax=Rosa chinensis TaxID=74649 RepID=UPI000D093EAE|nr:uncharacterized protein LOC112171195 [Rosa chinensis]
MNYNLGAKWEHEMTTNEEEEEMQEEEEEEEVDASLRFANKMMADAGNWWAYEQLHQQPQWGGSVAGRAYKNRQRGLANQRLLNDYFMDNPIFNEVEFRCRYRMRREVYLRMLDDVQTTNSHFKQSYDSVDQPSFLPYQKITCALRMLANACSANCMDESFRMPESIAIENMGQFCHTIVTIYRGLYLREPNSDDLDRLLQRAERRGFLMRLK